jgi:hypothetical protein
MSQTDSTATAGTFWWRTAFPLLGSLAAGCAILGLAGSFLELLTAVQLLCAILFFLLLVAGARTLWFTARGGTCAWVEASEGRHSQFTIGQLIFAVFFTSLLCGTTRWLGGESVAALALWLPGSWLLWTAIAHPDEAARKLLATHLVLALYLTVGPIFSYHVNGRAAYDYGLVGWNPPISRDETGKTWKANYDPKFTPPGTWPIIGPTMYTMCWVSTMVVVCPPIAPFVAMFTLFLLWRASVGRTRLIVAGWTMGCLPIAYLLIWGVKVLDWIAD